MNGTLFAFILGCTFGFFLRVLKISRNSRKTIQFPELYPDHKDFLACQKCNNLFHKEKTVRVWKNDKPRPRVVGIYCLQCNIF